MTEFWQRWLVVWCWIILAFGAVLAAGAIPALRAPTLAFFDLIFWPIDGQPMSFTREAVFSTALCGAILIGWGTLMLGLVRDRNLSRNTPIWRLMTFSMVVWYVIDNSISIGVGAPLNAVSNTLFLVGFLAPVIASGVLWHDLQEA